MQNFDNNYYDDRIIVDDEVEVKFEQKQEENEQRKYEAINYSNKNITTNNFFQTAFSRKFLALTLASLSIILTMFFKFLLICGVTSKAFMGIWFFICASLGVSALILNILFYVKNKKVDFNVSTILTLISLLGLILI